MKDYPLMASEDRSFSLGPPLQQNKYDQLTQTVVEGFSYPVRDHVTGTNIHVFVPASVHTAEGTAQLVEYALAPIRENIAANPQS